VGQGDSILTKTSNKIVLIDGGPVKAGSTLLNYLNTYQVSKIDLLFATHPHEDHIGRIMPVLKSSIPIQVLSIKDITTLLKSSILGRLWH
jgi:competence protein ComEC